MRSKVTKYIAVVLLTLHAFTFAEEESAVKADIFISSAPINADILIDGKRLKKKTPLILSLKPGNHDIEIHKAAFVSQQTSIHVNAGEIEIITFELDSAFTHTSYPDENIVIFNGKSVNTDKYSLSLPEGEYVIARRGELVHIEPVFPHNKLLTVLDLLIPVSVLVSGGLTAYQIFGDSNTQYALPPFLISSYVSSAAIIGYDIALRAEKNRFIENFPFGRLSLKTDFDRAEKLYNQAEEDLSLGNLNEALAPYSQIIHGYPDSFYFPLALYKIARINNIQNNSFIAKSAFQCIINEYPYHEIYDKACKNLADIYYNEGEFEKSLTYLGKMYVIDPLYTKEQLEEYRKEIQKAKRENR